MRCQLSDERKWEYSITIPARVVLIVIITILAALTPYPWYGRVAIFIGLFGFLWLIYPKFRVSLTRSPK
jgi:hypothetical protein